VIAINQFGMNPEQNGMMLSYIGAISLFMQGIGISTLTKRADDKILMGFSTMTLTVSYFVMVSTFFKKATTSKTTSLSTLGNFPQLMLNFLFRLNFPDFNQRDV